MTAPPPFSSTHLFSIKRDRIPLLDRYILHQLMVALAALSGGAVALVWLTQSLHFVSMIVQHGLSLRVFLHLTALMLPSFTLVILPVTTFLVVLFVYQRLTGDRELTVMQAAGLSSLELARSGLICALFSTGLCYVLSLWLTPASYHAFHRYEYEIRNRIAAFLLEEGVFTQVSPTMMVYVHRHESENTFYGVVIQDNRIPTTPVTILAEQGTMVPMDDAPRLILYHGSRQEIDRRTGQLSMLAFDKDILDFGNSHTRTSFDQDASELPLSVLFHPPAGIPHRYRGKLIVEGWQRLISPLTAFSYSVMGLVCVLRGRFSHHSNIIRPLVAILGMVGLLLLSLMLKNMAERNLLFIPLFWLETLLPGLVGLGLLLTNHYKDRNTEQAIRKLLS